MSRCRRPIVLLAASFLACVCGISAQEKGLAPAEGLENWKYDLDLGGYKSGKYNLVVEGVDKAGNVTRAAAMNIYVDPESDLPTVSIINPTPLERVGGDLNIVGTASDDDGIERVEVSVDGGDFQAADGKEFWSLYLKTADMSEGRRSLDVRAVDINGLEGPSSRVAFDLDLTKPLATVDSPAIGTLVAGQARLVGSVFDANGVRSLEISRDEGAWEKVDLKKGDKEGTTKAFSFEVDTRKIPDGPHVFRLRSADSVGSVSSDAYLMYVDNTKPSIEVVRPAEGQAVNGVFALVGAARDVVGLRRLSYDLGPEDKGDIPLTSGDPYFVKEIDSGKVKGDTATLTLEAEDAIGNVTRLVKKIKIDRAADKPVLRILGPSAESSGKPEKGAAPLPVLRESDLVWGSVADDDGVSSLRWSLDGAEASEAACSEVFVLGVPPASSGRHVLTLVPVDSNGLAGDAVSLAFTMDKGPGTAAFERLATAKASREFAQGIEVAVDSEEFLEGSIEILNPPITAEYSIAGGAAKALALAKDEKSGKARFRIPIDRSLPYGFAAVSVRARDAVGNVYGAQALLYVTNYSIAREEPGFRFSDARLGEDGRMAFGRAAAGAAAVQAKPLQGAFYGGELASVRLDPPTDIVSVGFDGRIVTVKPEKDGSTPPTRLYGKTTKGREFSSDAFVFATDFSPPEVKIESPAGGSWLKLETTVQGSAIDAGGGPVSLSWRRLPDGERASVPVGQGGGFSFSIAPAAVKPGPFSIEVEAKDQSGNAGYAYLSLGMDADAPAVRFLSPEDGAEVWGPEDVAAAVEDASGIAAVEYSDDGASFSPIPWTGRYFAHRADLAANPKAAYRITDKAGNAAIARPRVGISPPPARAAAFASISVDPLPGEARVEMSGSSGSLKVSATLPGLSEEDFAALGGESSPPPERFSVRLLAQGAISLKGQASVDTLAKSVELSRDGGATYAVLASSKDERTAKAALAFSIAVEASKMPLGAARWSIKVEDFQGNSFFCPLYLFVDSKGPTASLIYPEAGASSSPGPFPFVFKAEDESAIASAEVASGTSPAQREALTASPGARYFARIVDPSAAGAKGGPQAFSAIVRDAAGNQTALAAKIAYDAAGDAPALALDSLEQRPGGLVSGSVSDDDGAPPVRISVDGGAATEFPSGSFAFAMPAAPGKRSIAVEARSGDAWIPLAKREAAIGAAAPALGDFVIADSSAKGGSSVPWAPGADFALGPSSALGGTVASSDGKATVTASFNGGTPVQASVSKGAEGSGSLAFSAPIPAGLPYGRVTVELKAKDGSGLESSERLELHKVLPPSAGVDDDEGLRFADDRIAEAEGGKRMLLKPGEIVAGRFNGRPIASAALRPEAAALAAAFDGEFVTLEAKAEGSAIGARLEVKTVDGEIFSWGPFSAFVDLGPPIIEAASPADGDWTRNEIKVAASASDPSGVASFTVSAAGGESSRLPAEGILGSGAVAERTLALDSVQEGIFRIEFVARDGAGREARASRFAIKDTTPPALSQVSPAVGEAVNGLTTVAGEARDEGRLASVSFLQAAGAGTEEVSGLGLFWKDLDLARLSIPLADGGGFVAVDRAGNRTVLAPALVVDKEKDKPVIEIHAPSEGEVLRGDFVISGVAYDDDGLAAAYYRIDGGAWSRIEMKGASFSVPIALKDTTDNEHLVEAKAEDIFGVQGDMASRAYRISKEEPVALMVAPSIAGPVRGKVRLAGTSSDANGMKEVSVSVDNRTTFDKPAGLEEWGIDLDSATLSDGIHAVAVRPVDGYDTAGFYATMISVDNTPPKAQLDLPFDGQKAAGYLEVSGRISDNMAIASARIEAARVGSATPPVLSIDVGADRIVRREIDLSSLDTGVYSIRLIVRDKAGNETLASRDIDVVARTPVGGVFIEFPVDGARLSGRLRVQGYATAAGAGAVTVMSDGAALGSAEPDALGWFSVDVPPDAMGDGDHVLTAAVSDRDGRSIESAATRIEWARLGPWVSIDSFASGKYVPYRPFLKGEAGWDAEAAPEGDKAALAAYRKAAESRKVAAVDVSLDDGKSFEPAKGAAKWSFRLETQLYKEGSIRVIVRATFADGSTASSKALFFLDKTAPEVEVLSPEEGGRFNGVLELSGRGFDGNGMSSVGVALRKGDKSIYQVPSFIQGLYLDGQMLGATDWQAGAGLTFFDDNVKLQAIFGQAPAVDDEGSPQSFYGDVIGGKLIANVAYLPFESFFGADWSFLSASLGLGAGFSYFSETQAGTGLLVGSVFGQLEFPKISFPNLSVFKTISFYTECQVWVLSSVVSGGFVPKMSFGARIGVF